jgi:uncharacterized protein YcfJ
MKIASLVLASALLPACAAMAYDDDGGRYGYQPEGGQFYDEARVVRVEPIIARVASHRPREECREEETVRYDDGYRSATPMIVGGIIGGVLGSTMGHGNGRTAATVAGTVLGGSIGHDIGASRHARPGYETYCRVVDDYTEEERVEGYRVTYVYHGEEYVTRMNHDPGRRLRVRVAVLPDE